MTTDTLHDWEKWPIGGLVASAGLNTALWYAGGILPEQAQTALPWITLIAAVASVVAIDGSLVATIAGMRAGRYSGWSVASIIVAGLFTMCAALAHQTLPGLGPWLHGAFALTFVTYAMHLAQPRQESTNPLVASLQAELIETRRQLTDRQGDVNVTVNNLTLPPPIDDSCPLVVRLKDADKLSFAQIGEQLGITRQAAWQQYKAAKKQEVS